MEREKLDIKKWFKSFVVPVDWWKAANIGIKIIVIAAVIMGSLWCVAQVKHWFEPKKATSQTQSPAIAHADNVNFTQKTENKHWGLTLQFSQDLRHSDDQRIEGGVIYLF